MNGVHLESVKIERELDLQVATEKEKRMEEEEGCATSEEKVKTRPGRVLCFFLILREEWGKE